MYGTGAGFPTDPIPQAPSGKAKLLFHSLTLPVARRKRQPPQACVLVVSGTNLPRLSNEVNPSCKPLHDEASRRPFLLPCLYRILLLRSFLNPDCRRRRLARAPRACARPPPRDARGRGPAAGSGGGVLFSGPVSL